MKKAWDIYRKAKNLLFGECLHRAWISFKSKKINQKRIETAKQTTNVTEEVNTYNEWKKLGYIVSHGAKALFNVKLIWGSRGDDRTYTAAFFGRSQVQKVIA